VRAVLEHKFYFDELYDAVFYRPTVFVAVTLRGCVRRAHRPRLDHRDLDRRPARRG
jgi:hypothetical protein